MLASSGSYGELDDRIKTYILLTVPEFLTFNTGDDLAQGACAVISPFSALSSSSTSVSIVRVSSCFRPCGRQEESFCLGTDASFKLSLPASI